MKSRTKKATIIIIVLILIVLGPSIFQSAFFIPKIGCVYTHVDIHSGKLRYQYYYCGIKFMEKIEQTYISSYIQKHNISCEKPEWKFINGNGILLSQFCILGEHHRLYPAFHTASITLESMDNSDFSGKEKQAFVENILYQVKSGDTEKVDELCEDVFDKIEMK